MSVALPRGHRGAVGQVGRRRGTGAPAGPPAPPGGGLPARRARPGRTPTSCSPSSWPEAPQRPAGRALPRRDRRGPARRPRARARHGRRPVPRGRPRATTACSSSAPTSPGSRRPPSSRPTPGSPPNLGDAAWCSSRRPATATRATSRRARPASVEAARERACPRRRQSSSTRCRRSAARRRHRRAPRAARRPCPAWALPEVPAAARRRPWGTSWPRATAPSSTATRRCSTASAPASSSRRCRCRTSSTGSSRTRVVIVPGDRDDVLLGVLLAHQSTTLPSLSGSCSTGASRSRRRSTGWSPASASGCRSSRPAAGRWRPRRRSAASRAGSPSTSERKVRAAVALVEEAASRPRGRRRGGASAAEGRRDAPDVRARPRRAGPRGVRARRAARGRRGAHPARGRPGARPRHRPAHPARRRGGRPGQRRASSASTSSAATVVDPATSPLREEFAARVRTAAGAQGRHARDGPRPGRRPELLRHDAGARRAGRRHGVRLRHDDRPHHPPGARGRAHRPGVSVVSSVFLMCLADRVLVYGDCAVNPDPTAEQLADIAISSARTAAAVRHRAPRRDAVLLDRRVGHRSRRRQGARGPPRWCASGRPGCSSTARSSTTRPSTPQSPAPSCQDSPVAGRATVLVFPDLNTGNNTYKAVQRSAGAVAIGPGAAGAEPAGQRPVPGRPRARHRQHRRDHRGAGGSGPVTGPAEDAPARADPTGTCSSSTPGRPP